MADIKLGQSINGSFTSSDPKNTSTSPTNPLGFGTFGRFYDDYDLKGVDNFQQLKISVENPNVTANTGTVVLQLVNAATGAILAEEKGSNDTPHTLFLDRTTFPGVNYKIRVADITLGDYKISVVDGGKASSIVSPSRTVNGGSGFSGLSDKFDQVGTVGANGVYFPFASGFPSPFADIALSSNGQFYGITSSLVINASNLYKIDPSLDLAQQVALNKPSLIADVQGNKLESSLSAIEFGADGKLYGIGTGSTGGKLFQIDVNTSVATSIADLPTGLNGSGDLVYDAASSSFFAVSEDTATSDALWKIPLANPSGATKIGQVGFTGVGGINFENGQLTGFTGATNSLSFSPVVGNRIKINASSGVGTIDTALSATDSVISSRTNQNIGISGASTIFALGGSSTTQTSLADFKKDPVKYMGAIRDYDGNNLGGSSTWKAVGDVDINGDGTLESILVNPKIERFASVGSVGGNIDFTKNGLNGDTRVVGIYIDPTLKNSPEKIGGPFDSQRRFQNDLKIDNLKVLAAGDYNKDGFQDLYFKVSDGSAVLRAEMFKDGNIQYANYQSKADLTAFMTTNNVPNSVWGNWI
jgi:hypothetical protein